LKWRSPIGSIAESACRAERVDPSEKRTETGYGITRFLEAPIPSAKGWHSQKLLGRDEGITNGMDFSTGARRRIVSNDPR